MQTAFWIIDQLIQQGITHFCIAPGSRNTPLIVAATEHPQATTIVHYDERGFGFYALGYAKGAKKPAAIIATSGTAIGNLLPSVMEAHHSHTPMILLTGDRPVELRDCGANQTSDQVKLFSPFVRWQGDLPPELSETYFRSTIGQALFHAVENPPGPVHINCQFREPLVRAGSFKSGSPIHFAPSHIQSDPIRTNASRGLILIGNIPEDPLPILELAKQLRWPVCADILSNARNNMSETQIRHFDWIAKTSPHLKPEFILHFGDRLTSKQILEWPVTLHVSPYPHLQDPKRSLQMRARSDIAPFCKTFQGNTDLTWLDAWKKRDLEIETQFQSLFRSPAPFTEAHAMQCLSAQIPPDTAIFLGNGMPIRDADRFLFPKKCRGFFSNRGLSGIDGNIATAAGLANGLGGPVIAFLGDQTCLHDLNSLPLLKKTDHPVTLIISNNFGGGVFSHLPIANWAHMDTHIAASHSWRFGDAARMFGLPYLPFDKISFAESAVIELVTSRQDNFLFQQLLYQTCRE